jgi:hypothetical protein
MSLLSMLMLMLILRDHIFRIVLLLFSMCLQSFSWLISLRKLRLALIISFNSPKSVLLIHHEFEGGIRYALVFLLLYLSRGSLYILPLLYMYIYESVALK